MEKEHGILVMIFLQLVSLFKDANVLKTIGEYFKGKGETNKKIRELEIENARLEERLHAAKGDPQAVEKIQERLFKSKGKPK